MKNNLLILLTFILPNFIYAQSITGTITDELGDPLIGVHVLNYSGDKHAHTDDKGNFNLSEINIGDSLKITYIGFKEKMIAVLSLSEPMTIILEPKSISLSEVVIAPSIDALNAISDIDILTNPVNSSQEILTQVPGLFIGQHAGGGKAEQIFLRGFDIDHGTDIELSVDGLPVNMVSHAHGQGYADLHFVIPETIENIDFGKGPYYAEKGNFNTAGYVNFKIKSNLDQSLFKIEKGQYNSNRMLGMFNLVNTTKNQAYIATEYLINDGPFESPQNFSRLNLFAKYTSKISDSDKVSVTLSRFTSTWDASGQIPQRLVDDGSITRFGAVDDTEGGTTSRTNFIISYDKFLSENTILKNSVYYSKYDFELFSNFTFFLEDPVNGDQIKQKENRDIFGLNSEYKVGFSSNHFDGSWQVGFSLRNDQSKNNELSHTANRAETIQPLKLGDINETNFGTYVGTTINYGKWTINPALRFDYFDFQYNDELSPTYRTQSETKSIISPKFNILYNYSRSLQIYLKTGKGFHSNDTRVVVEKNGTETLPSATGLDLGLLWKPYQQLLVNIAYWQLDSEQEFVYVGDAGIIELSGPSKRRGFDLSLRHQTMKWLFWNLDLNYTHARSLEEESGNDYIPLAPDLTLTAGLNFIHDQGFYSGINFRYMDHRPANQDNSIIAKGYAIFDFNLGYQFNKFDFGLQVQNVLNTEWNETQFATESRLNNESSGIEEIHFTPGTPFLLKGSIEFKF